MRHKYEFNQWLKAPLCFRSLRQHNVSANISISASESLLLTGCDNKHFYISRLMLRMVVSNPPCL